MKRMSRVIIFVLFSLTQIAFCQDLPSYIKSAQNFYNINNYKKAYPIYEKIINQMKYNDGLILYQYYYTYRVLYGMDTKCQMLLKNANTILLLQYPNHQYARYTTDRLRNISLKTDESAKSTTAVDNTVVKDMTSSTVGSYNYPFPVAENGDIYGHDNDGDGRAETVYVSGYYRKDGTYVRSHYRASPKK